MRRTRPYSALKDNLIDGNLVLASENAADTVIEMAICEVPYLQLHANRLYRFIVMPTCEQCLDIERKLKQ